MRGSVLCSFALLLGVRQSSAAQDVVSASSGVLQYFEGAVLLDTNPVEHKAAVFPSLKNGSVIRTAKGRAELLLTPGVYLRLDENSALRMESNSLMDTRIVLIDGSAIVDTLNATPQHVLALVFRESTVRFPKPGIFRINAELGELEAYSGEAEITHEDLRQQQVSLTLDSSHLYYFALGLTTNKFGDGATDEFYDWARNRSEVIADQNQIASAEQQEAQDADPGAGVLTAPPTFSSPGSDPAAPLYGYSVYGSAVNPLYLNAGTPFLGGMPALGVIIVAAPVHRPGTKWPVGSRPGYRPVPVITQWPTPKQSGFSYVPGTTLRFPTGSMYRAPVMNSRPIVTTAPRPITPPVAVHSVAPHVGAVGHR